MSNSYDTPGHGSKGVSVGVSMYNPVRVTYNPNSHNPPAPIRPGSADAFKCNSLDHTGNYRPYWADKEEA